MRHDHVIALDERHAGLLSPIVIALAAWFLAAFYAERRGLAPFHAERRARGLTVVAVACAIAVAGLLVSPLMAAYLVQWPIAAGLGVWFARTR